MSQTYGGKMDIIAVVVALVIGAIAGWLAGVLVEGAEFGLRLRLESGIAECQLPTANCALSISPVNSLTAKLNSP